MPGAVRLQVTEVRFETEVREALTGDELLTLPVRFNRISLGRPVDLAVDLGQARVLAIEVLCRDEESRFLPLPAARIRSDAIVVDSPLALVDAGSSAFYRERTHARADLRGAVCARGDVELGRLCDVVILSDGRIVELVVEGPYGRRRVPLDDRLRIASRGCSTR